MSCVYNDGSAVLIARNNRMSILRFQNVSLRYENVQVLRDVYFRLDAGERIGLIGKNGSGKTTVLRLLTGQLEPTEGRVERDAGFTIGYFSQFSELDGERSILQVVQQLFAEVRAWEQELAEINAKLEHAGEAELTRLLARQSELIELMNQRDGWEYERHIDVALTRLGFSAARRAQPIDQLSGGWRNRAALAKCLLEQPDVLLLDEPTNFLDIAGVAWLENWLTQFRGGVVVVSHDRRFLDRVLTRVIEVENYHLHDYSGNYSAYVREKHLRIKSLERQFQHEEELLILEGEAIRDIEAARRDPSQALQRKLADVKKRREPRPIETIVTSLYQGLHVPDNLVRVEGVAKAYGDQQLFDNLTFELNKGERLAIVGPNGTGKSTLLRILTGAEAPDAGRVVWAGGAPIADYNQMLVEIDLDDSVTHAVNIMGLVRLAPRKQVNRFLSLLRFSERDLNRRIRELSGGQRARVALAQCLLSDAAVLILDEPTNHLDVPSIQVMEQALIYFPGAVIVVSHDRFFIDKIATRLLVFDGVGHVHSGGAA
jgi:ATPase subunit of ABC transporter with duplicated ATPase domains